MIIFERVRWKNFLSTGNDGITIDLNRHKTLLFVGRNGAGKSTLLDAICFVLYGKAFRNINKPQLVNSINKKDCLAEIWFSIGNNHYYVKRGINPGLFEISLNDKLLNQTDNRDYQKAFERDVLKLTYQAFIQIVTLGIASFTPFMQLTTGDRRALIDTLLDVQVFTTMGSILKGKITKNSEDTKEMTHNITLLEQKIKFLKRHDSTVKANREEQYKQAVMRLGEVVAALEQNKAESGHLEYEVNELVTRLVEQEKFKKDLHTAQKYLEQIQHEVKKREKDEYFFEHTVECPTCTQQISEEHKHKVKQQIDKEIADLKRHQVIQSERIDVALLALKPFETVASNLQKKRLQLAEVNSMLKMNLTSMASLEKEVEEAGKEPETTVDEAAIKEGEGILAKFNKRLDELKNERHIYSLAAGLLKDDGIKTTIVKRYIPIINKFVNKFLASMDFFVNFELDESFKEKIMSRYRDEFSYASFSEGEKLRIDLALLFTWRSIAKLRNSASTNLLIIDEIFESSLDGPGIDDFTKLLNNFSEEMNVIILSPKGDSLFDKFENVVRFEKHQNFTRIKGK